MTLRELQELVLFANKTNKVKVEIVLNIIEDDNCIDIVDFEQIIEDPKTFLKSLKNSLQTN